MSRRLVSQRPAPGRMTERYGAMTALTGLAIRATCKRGSGCLHTTRETAMKFCRAAENKCSGGAAIPPGPARQGTTAKRQSPQTPARLYSPIAAGATEAADSSGEQEHTDKHKHSSVHLFEVGPVLIFGTHMR